MHPEVLARLQKLGLDASGVSASDETPGGISSPRHAGYSNGPDAVAASELNCNSEISASAADGSNSARVKTLFAAEMAKVRNCETTDKKTPVHENSVDDLLLQLEDLDARSKALQKQEALESKARNEESKTRALLNKERVRPPRPAPIPEVAEPAESSSCRDPCSVDAENACSIENADGVGTNAASAIASQHPLDGVRLASVPQGDAMQQTWRNRRNDRPPVAPGTPVQTGASNAKADYGGSSPAKACRLERRGRSSLNASTSSLPPAPSSARGPRPDNNSNVSLPPLKPSASAPGRLGAHDTSWLKQIHRSAS